jgi:adenylate cyclase
MEERRKDVIRIDLSQFKLHIRLRPKTELTLHFDSPSRKFYLSVIALVVNEMKKLRQITSIPVEAHIDQLILLNETIGASAGSSDKNNLLLRIYKKWKDALPDLEKAPLFKVMGKKKEHDDATGKTYRFSEAEKDIWANLFEYKGSKEHLRLRFSMDKLGAGLDNATIVYEDSSDAEAWELFVSSLHPKPDHEPLSERAVSIPERRSTPLPAMLKGNVVRLIPHGSAVLITALAVAIVVLAFIMWQTYKPVRAGNVASVDRMAFSLPDKPSIAVLPFVSIGGDKEQEYFSDGLTEEIINAISKLRNVFVIARNSTFTYKGKDVKFHQVAEEMGVQYVLEGSVRKTGNKVRVTAQLADAFTGHHLLSERYECDIEDIFALQDEITMKVLTAMRVLLNEGETARVMAKGTKNLDAYLKVMQASQNRVAFNKQAFALSRKLAEEAIALDPKYALAYSVLAIVLVNGIHLGQYEEPKAIIDLAKEAAEKAVKLDDSLAYAHSVLSQVLVFWGDYDKSMAEAQRALDLEPGSAYSHFQVGASFNYSSRYEQAVPPLKNSLRLSPVPFPSCLANLGYSYLMLGRYEESMAVLDQLIRREPNMMLGHLYMAATCMMAGKEARARAEAAEVLRVNPEFSLTRYEKGHPLKDRANLRDRLIQPLAKAGLQ